MQLLFSSMSHRNKVLACSYVFAIACLLVGTCSYDYLRVGLNLRWLSNERFATGGSKHLYFWEPSEVNSLTVKQKALFGRAGVQTCTAICAHPANSTDGGVVGTASGKLLVFKSRNVSRILNAHDGPVSVLRCVTAVGVVSGGLDAKIRVWFPDVTPGVVFDLKHLGSLNPIVQSIDWDYPHNK
jgi:hypothetical protein